MEHRVFIVVKRNNMFMSNEGVFTSESDADEFIRNRKALKDKDDNGHSSKRKKAYLLLF